MEIRQLRAEEYELSARLSEYAFQYTLTPEQREKNRKQFKPERSWGVFEGEDLQAKLTIHPFQVYLHGEVLDMGGIASVATWPENRRKGHVTTLLKNALEVMKEAGQTLSLLHPFSIPFYRKYGWELYSEYKEYEIPVRQLPPRRDVPGRIVRGIEDISILGPIYEAFAARYNGTMAREEDWWERSVMQDYGFSAVYYSETGEPQGYVLYKLKDRELLCDEFVYLNEEARSALLTFFGQHDARIDRVKMTFIPCDDQLPFMLTDPRIKQEIHAYAMARIVDIKAFLKKYPFTDHHPGELTLRVEDASASWNEGVWRIKVNEQGRADVIMLPESSEDADLSADIQTLTALFMGYKHPLELHGMNRLRGAISQVKRMDSMIPAGQTFLLDFF